jgi:hypothetical protein
MGADALERLKLDLEKELPQSATSEKMLTAAHASSSRFSSSSRAEGGAGKSAVVNECGPHAREPAPMRCSAGPSMASQQGARDLSGHRDGAVRALPRLEVMYHAATFGDRMLGHGAPIRVNASAALIAPSTSNATLPHWQLPL